MRLRLSIFAAAAVLAAFPGAAVAAHPGEPGIRPGRTPWDVGEAADSPDCGAHFCVHWAAIGVDAPNLARRDQDGIPDYVERVLAVAENVHHVENEVLGWREPLGDGTRGGGHDKTDIYLTELAGEQVFGYTATDAALAPAGAAPKRRSAYLVLDNDYSRFDYPGTEPGRDLRVTLAHEYDHVLQYGYDAEDVERDPWFAESSAVWMEDQVYNGVNDYLRYVRRWAGTGRRTWMWRRPLTQGSMKEYGSAVWNEWLVHHYGRPIVREAWADAAGARPAGFAVAAYEEAIRAAGPSTFGRDFTRFAADASEWRTGIGFRESYLYPDLPRQGRLAPDGAPETRRLNHTTFALLRIPAAAGRAVEVEVKAPRGVAAGLALVGRLGSERHGRTVKALAYREAGGELVARLPDPGRFRRITAVVVNADTTTSGFDPGERAWRYTANHEPFEISGRLVRRP
ncbi:MAG TPA: MXAN_6640 family putative metalloprotease [Solirubrobacterales bacterium]|nr:MXAN_6640 family putative metalloprotease [Solirubrobacterales bacterium]